MDAPHATSYPLLPPKLCSAVEVIGKLGYWLSRSGTHRTMGTLCNVTPHFRHLLKPSQDGHSKLVLWLKISFQKVQLRAYA